jgi:nucleotide-binding universal stress UspA family protein
MLPVIKTILYATGLSDGAPYVFRYALSLARQHGAKIIVVHAVEPLSAFGQSLVEQYISHQDSEEMHSKARQTVKAQIEERIKQLCARECNGTPECGNSVETIQVVEGYPDQVILHAAKACRADVIVMGAQRHSLVGEVMLGSNTRKVLQRAEQPVFVVRVPKGTPETF